MARSTITPAEFHSLAPRSKLELVRLQLDGAVLYLHRAAVAPHGTRKQSALSHARGHVREADRLLGLLGGT